jgi:hypothetical protein
LLDLADLHPEEALQGGDVDAVALLDGLGADELLEHERELTLE